MINLEKNADDWSDWSVTINNTIYKLGNVGSMYSDKTYDVWLDEGHLPLSILKEMSISKLPSELILYFYAANGELGKNVEYISLCTHPEERHLSYTWEGANKRGNSSRLTQSFHFFMFEPIFSPVNALNQPI